MTEPAHNLIFGYLDESLTASQQEELAAWIRESSEHAREFVDALLLHDRLQAEVVAAGLLEDSGSTVLTASPARQLLRRSLAMAAAACVAVFVGLIGWQLAGSPAVAATVELERIIQANEAARDRTYVVTALEENAAAKAVPTASGRAVPPVDGALLHVRRPNQYVLVRFLADGTNFVTGCDGTTAWSVPPRGRVRVSGDPQRFRGAVPGQQHAIPFIDLRSSLQQLQSAYDLETSSETSPEGWCRLKAKRKPTAAGGPKDVTIWYDVATGTIHAMLLDRLPQARGGPTSVVLELLEERDLGPDFFGHAAHHESDRPVVLEE